MGPESDIAARMFYKDWEMGMGRKPIKRTDSVPKRILKKCLAIILFLILPVLVFLFSFRLEEVSVMGTTRYTPDEIKERYIKTELDNNTLIFYLKYKYFEEPEIPFIEKADIKIKGRHAAEIRLYEKRITGGVEFMGDYLYFDKDGIVVEASSEHLTDIPLIKGLKFNKVILGEKLEVQKDELFNVILNLTQLIEKYSLDVKTINFSREYEVTVDCGSVVALLGKRNTYDEVLSGLKSILADENGELKGLMNGQEGTYLELDMTKYGKNTDRVIAKPKIKSE